MSDIPFTQNDFDEFIESINQTVKDGGQNIIKPEPIKDSPFNVQNVQYKKYSTKRTTTKETETKETYTNKHLLSIVNKGSPEEIEKELINICNKFYTQFALGRWSKNQWNTLIKRFVSELVYSGKYLQIDSDRIESYIYKSLVNIADHHDYKNSQEYKDYQDIMSEIFNNDKEEKHA